MQRLLALICTAGCLPGCGVISLEGRTPPLSAARAVELAERYYDGCNESAEIGQCDSLLSPITKPAPGQLKVEPPFAGWVRIVTVRSNAGASSLDQPAHEQAELTATGARFCGSGLPRRAGDSIAGCQWLIAPATVTVGKLMQSGDKATLIGRIAFSPVNPAIAGYMRGHFDTAPLDALAKAQGREITLHFTHANNAWRVGNPESQGVTAFFMAVVGLILLFVFRALGMTGRGNESIPAGAAPNIGFPSGTEE